MPEVGENPRPSLVQANIQQTTKDRNAALNASHVAAAVDGVPRRYGAAAGGPGSPGVLVRRRSIAASNVCSVLVRAKM